MTPKIAVARGMRLIHEYNQMMGKMVSYADQIRELVDLKGASYITDYLNGEGVDLGIAGSDFAHVVDGIESIDDHMTTNKIDEYFYLFGA